MSNKEPSDLHFHGPLRLGVLVQLQHSEGAAGAEGGVASERENAQARLQRNTLAQLRCASPWLQGAVAA
jgi:hypothetical protein